MEIYALLDSAFPFLARPAASDSGVSQLETWLEFIARITEASVWPVLLLVLVCLFREELKGAATSIKSFRIGNTEATFEKSVEEAKEMAKSLDPVSPQTAEANQSRTITLLDKARVSPVGAIVDSFKDIETAAQELGRIVQSILPDDEVMQLDKVLRSGGRNLVGIDKALMNLGVLTPYEVDLYRRIRGFRNRAVHEPSASISPALAENVVRLSDQLVDTLTEKAQSYGHRSED